MNNYKMDKKVYMLEVQRYPNNINVEKGFVHVGYYKKCFRTKQEAAEFYDSNNKHMRKLNAHGDWRSDWDPKTYFRYVVRRCHGEFMTINSF